MSEPVFNIEQVVIDPITMKFVPTIDPTGGTFVEGLKVTITGLLADGSGPVTLGLRRGQHPYVWEEITDLKPSTAKVYVQSS